jgi:hypothetical protein
LKKNQDSKKSLVNNWNWITISDNSNWQFFIRNDKNSYHNWFVFVYSSKTGAWSYSWYWKVEPFNKEVPYWSCWGCYNWFSWWWVTWSIPKIWFFGRNSVNSSLDYTWDEPYEYVEVYGR